MIQTKDSIKAIIEVYRLMKECIDFENIEDRKFIYRNLNLIEDYKSVLSTEMYSAVEDFIFENIKPIVFDTNYFDFLIKEDFGAYDDEGHFVINSDRSFDRMILLLIERTVELSKKLDTFAAEHLNLDAK